MIIIISLFAIRSSWAQEQKYSCSTEEIAFYGNDITTYYDEEVKEGTAEFYLEYDGLNLWFSSLDNKNKFKSNPDKYLPAYGGWCAIALSQGLLATPDFNHFKIQDGKLLFFEVRAFFNGKTAWDKKPKINKINADKSFKKIFLE